MALFAGSELYAVAASVTFFASLSHLFATVETAFEQLPNIPKDKDRIEVTKIIFFIEVSIFRFYNTKVLILAIDCSKKMQNLLGGRQQVSVKKLSLVIHSI